MWKVTFIFITFVKYTSTIRDAAVTGYEFKHTYAYVYLKEIKKVRLMYMQKTDEWGWHGTTQRCMCAHVRARVWYRFCQSIQR